MSRICGYRCEHNKSGICQISVCDKKSNMQASYETSITNPKKQLEFYKQLSEQLQQENKQLKDNWNELRKWIVYNKHNENTEQHYLVVDYGTLLGKM